MEGHTIYYNDEQWTTSGASLGHGTATGEPRAGRCQVEREDGRTSEVSPPRDTRPVEPGVKDGGQSDGRMGWAKMH